MIKEKQPEDISGIKINLEQILVDCELLNSGSNRSLFPKKSFKLKTEPSVKFNLDKSLDFETCVKNINTKVRSLQSAKKQSSPLLKLKPIKKLSMSENQIKDEEISPYRSVIKTQHESNSAKTPHLPRIFVKYQKAYSPRNASSSEKYSMHEKQKSQGKDKQSEEVEKYKSYQSMVGERKLKEELSFMLVMGRVVKENMLREKKMLQERKKKRKLDSLKMKEKGVQKMNSISDQRESYFKNKVTSLMTKGVVIKSLKQNPMKKKAKHQEVSCQQQPKSHSKQQTKKVPELPQAPKPISTINHIELKEKQKQFEMRVQYSRQENNPDNLKKLMLQEECREENISKKINSIINNHEERLKERIKARKLRTATYRTQSVFNQESETQPSTNNFNSNRKEDAYFFQPNENLPKNMEEANYKVKNLRDSVQRKWRSLERAKQPVESPKRKRKNTIDLSEV